MESIFIVFIKHMGAAISGHWTVSPDCRALRDPGTSRDYDVLVRQAISINIRPRFSGTSVGLRDSFARRYTCGAPGCEHRAGWVVHLMV